MNHPAIAVHYHELWLKGRNRKFYVRKLTTALRTSLDGLGLIAVEQAGDRLILWFRADGQIEESVSRLRQVLGIAFFAVARSVNRDLEEIADAAWEELKPLVFRSFAVRAKRSDKSFPHSSVAIEKEVGRVLQQRLRGEARSATVRLKEPDVTCYVEITPRPALVYARRHNGTGGLPANTAGRMMCLLSGGFDSAVAAYQMMKRGAHVSFVHFHSAGAQPGESSLHVASELVQRLVIYQFHAKLYRVRFDAIQREIARNAPEDYRVLLYRRMMLRIAEALATRDRALALLMGDSLSQVASQTLRNLVAVDKAVSMTVFRPLAGADKQEILATARKIGTFAISAEPFHDCCPIFLPRNPALRATAENLAEAETKLDVAEMVRRGVHSATALKYVYKGGAVNVSEATSAWSKHEAVIA
ncbi:MAG: tRNA uracil 4-sulfurtransferase ThiI [Candidatus Acidiferrales bacterium]